MEGRKKVPQTEHKINLWSSMPLDITESSKIQKRFDNYE